MHNRQSEIGKAALEGVPAAQYQIARRYLTGLDDFTPSMPSCLLWLDRAAKGGDPEAQSMLGIIFIV